MSRAFPAIPSGSVPAGSALPKGKVSFQVVWQVPPIRRGADSGLRRNDDRN